MKLKSYFVTFSVISTAASQSSHHAITKPGMPVPHLAVIFPTQLAGLDVRMT